MHKLILLFLCLLIVSPGRADDEIEGLIDKEKDEIQQWISQDEDMEDLPPVWLLGTQSSVVLFSHLARSRSLPQLCESLELDELIDLSGGREDQDRVRINWKKPSVRDTLSKRCWVRPKDPLIVVDRGKNSLVWIDDIFVVRRPLRCRRISSYELVGSYTQELSADPLFLTSNLEIKEGDNGYRPYKDLPRGVLSDEVRSKLAKINPFIAEFSIKTSTVTAKNVDGFIWVRKKEIFHDDEGVPNQALYWFHEGNIQELISETVEKSRKTGHVGMGGVLDFNSDELLDVIVEGDRGGCPYRLLFKGEETGFQKVKVPVRCCSC